MSSFSLDSIDHSMALDTEMLAVPSGRGDFEASQLKQEEAESARLTGDYTTRLHALTAAMEAGGPTTSLLSARADCLLHLRRPGAALADTEAALKLNPDSAKALKYRGICKAYLGMWIDANADLSSAQRIDFNEDLEPSRRVAAERAAAMEVAEREKRIAEAEVERTKKAEDLEKKKRERVFADFGSQMLTKSGVQTTASAIGRSKLIGVYFSAHWCPPCRQFTPMLAEIYSTIREEESDLLPGLKTDEHALEIVFVSSDRDQKSFEEYYSEQPWVSLPFSEMRVKQELSQKFSVSGIPALFILRSENGTIVDSDGRSTVMQSRGDVRKLFKAWKLL